MWLGGDECSKPDQAEDRRGVYRNCGWEQVSVCGKKSIKTFPGVDLQSCMAGCEHVVYNVICQLRRKLKNPDLIQTVVGRGYKFVG